MSHDASPRRYHGMVYRPCGRSGLRLPLLSLSLWHNFGDSTPLERQREMLFTAFDLGSPTSIWPTTTARPTAAPSRTSAASFART
jgi:hypothetical protein